MASVLMLKITRAFQPAGLARQYFSEKNAEYTNTSTVFTLIDEAKVYKRIDLIDAYATDGEVQEPAFGYNATGILNSREEFMQFILNESPSVREDQDTLIVLSVNDNEIGQVMFSEEAEWARLMLHPEIREINNLITSAQAEFKVDYYTVVEFKNFGKHNITIYRGRDNTNQNLISINDYSSDMFYTKDAIQNLFKFIKADDNQIVVFAIKVDDKPTQPLMCQIKDINIHLSDIADIIHGNTKCK